MVVEGYKAAGKFCFMGCFKVEMKRVRTRLVGRDENGLFWRGALNLREIVESKDRGDLTVHERITGFSVGGRDHSREILH